MIKGAQRRMIVIKTASSSIFEEAYFVVRNGHIREERDMIDEANRIIDANGAGKRNKKEKRRDGTRPLLIGLCGFMGGSAVGCAITLAVMLCA